jgi:hypothetical protein
MKTIKPFVTLLTIACLMLGLNSCALKNMLLPDPEPTVREEDRLPRKVAILPFVNRTSNPEAASVVRKMFYNFFSSLNYLDLEPFVIDDNLKRSGQYDLILSGQSVSAARLGQLLGVDAIIYGEILTLGKTYALIYSDNAAGLRAKMVRSDNEQVIWELEHNIRIQEGSMPLSLTGLAATIVKTAISHQKTSHLQAAAELCMQMVPLISRQPPNSACRWLRRSRTLRP